jgi:4-hydroxysphinganine ceramide fatty acyl 2-hydroxylase
MKAYPKITDKKVIYNDFEIDLTRGLVWQAMHLRLNQYIHMIENPIYLPYCRLFDSAFFEGSSRNKWYMIPSLWIPLTIYLVYLSLTGSYPRSSPFDSFLQLDSPSYSPIATLIGFICGLLSWTLLEYGLHRYAFHFEFKIPENPYWIWLHFIIHGIHHTIPMDPDRLVYPPILFVVTFTPLFYILTFFVPGNLGRLFVAGIVLGYICYDMTHYSVHHTSPPLKHFQEMKKYHSKHHYVDGNKGYGITSKFWDRVFNTELA